MSNAKYIYTLFGLSLLGSLFSGYLSAVKLFTDTCAFGEGCPRFLGYPACYFGFALFFILLVSVVLTVFQKISHTTCAKIMSLVSLLGVVFAGRFVLEEVVRTMDKGFVVTMLGLPTCAYGLVFYILVLITALKLKSRTR